MADMVYLYELGKLSEWETQRLYMPGIGTWPCFTGIRCHGRPEQCKRSGVVKIQSRAGERCCEQQSVAACASLAMSIKSVLDTPILDESGALTDESGTLMRGFDGNPE